MVSHPNTRVHCFFSKLKIDQHLSKLKLGQLLCKHHHASVQSLLVLTCTGLILYN